MLERGPTEEERRDISRAIKRLQQSSASEFEIQRLLGLRPTTARKFCDDIVNLGIAYRHNRELHLNVITLKKEAADYLRPLILVRLDHSPGTAHSLARELEEDIEVVKATAEAMRHDGQVHATACGPLMIYRKPG